MALLSCRGGGGGGGCSLVAGGSCRGRARLLQTFVAESPPAVASPEKTLTKRDENSLCIYIYIYIYIFFFRTCNRSKILTIFLIPYSVNHCALA